MPNIKYMIYPPVYDTFFNGELTSQPCSTNSGGSYPLAAREDSAAISGAFVCVEAMHVDEENV